MRQRPAGTPERLRGVAAYLAKEGVDVAKVARTMPALLTLRVSTLQAKVAGLDPDGGGGRFLPMSGFHPKLVCIIHFRPYRVLVQIQVS